MKSRQEILNELLSFLEERVTEGNNVKSKAGINLHNGSDVIVTITPECREFLVSRLKQLKLSCAEVGISILSDNDGSLLFIDNLQFKDFRKMSLSNNNNENINRQSEKVASNIDELFSFVDEQIKDKKNIADHVIFALDNIQFSYLQLSLKCLRNAGTDLGIHSMTKAIKGMHNIIIDFSVYQAFKRKHSTSNANPETISSNNVQSTPVNSYVNPVAVPTTSNAGFPPSFFSHSEHNANSMGNVAFIPYYYTDTMPTPGLPPVYYYLSPLTQSENSNSPQFTQPQVTYYFPYIYQTMPAYEAYQFSEQREQEVSQDNTNFGFTATGYGENSSNTDNTRKRKPEEDRSTSEKKAATTTENTAGNADPKDIKYFEELMNENQVEDILDPDLMKQIVQDLEDIRSKNLLATTETNDSNATLSSFHAGFFAYPPSEVQVESSDTEVPVAYSGVSNTDTEEDESSEEERNNSETDEVQQPGLPYRR